MNYFKDQIIFKIFHSSRKQYNIYSAREEIIPIFKKVLITVRVSQPRGKSHSSFIETCFYTTFQISYYM